MIARARQEQLFAFWLVQWGVGLLLVARGLVRLAAGQEFRGLDDICRCRRVAPRWPWGGLSRSIIQRHLRRWRAGRNTLIDSYLADPESKATAHLFTLTGRGPNDLFRDLIVLKPATADDKGVILLKYVRTFDAVIALFDIDRLFARYRVVLEPCWAGYCLPSLLMYAAMPDRVIVQCFTAEDLAFVRDVGPSLVPVPLGPADWVNADIFQAAGEHEEKTHDLVMVANWAPHKRHVQLFRALAEVRDRPLRVLLVGFPWGGRTADDIRREAAPFQLDHVTLEIVESVPAAEVARLVARSKVFVFLSRKEGDNKALVEAMFANVPVVVYERTIGGATSRVNPSTGVLTSDAALPATLQRMLDTWRDYAPRAWALTHTGSGVATRVLDTALREASGPRGSLGPEGIVVKTNAPNLAYADPADRQRFAADYAFISGCLRPGLAHGSPPQPVAASGDSR